jgi:nuclear transport factor 2 (NTF2) superfamily protein
MPRHIFVGTPDTIEHGNAILGRDRCATHEVDMTDREKTVETRPPLPPFTPETAALKVRLAEDGWNSRTPEKVALAYTVDSQWRNRA